MTGHDEHTPDQDAVQPPWIMDDIPEDKQGQEPVQHDPDLLFLACPACADGWMSGYIGGEWVCSTCGHKEERT